MIVAIHQPNFLPWLGFFYKLILSDKFVIFDDVQFPRGKSFGNRVLIKTNSGAQWLTIPILKKSELKLFNEVQIDNTGRVKDKIVKTIELNYKKAKYFNDIFPHLSTIIKNEYHKLFDLNFELLKYIVNYLDIKTELILSSSLTEGVDLAGPDKILSILNATGADEYLSGDGAGTSRYIDEVEFDNNKIKLSYTKFVHPVYNQFYGDFIPNCSIIDLLFHYGHESIKIIKNDLFAENI